MDCLNHKDLPKTISRSTIRRHTQEGLNPQQHLRENLMFPTADIFILKYLSLLVTQCSTILRADVPVHSFLCQMLNYEFFFSSALYKG